MLLKTHSIFFKLLLVLLGMGLLVNTVVFSGFKLSLSGDDFFRQVGFKNIRQYLSYLIEDMGVPPTEEQLKRIAADIGLEIRVEGQGLSLATKPKLPKLDQLESHHLKSRFRPKGLPGIQGHYKEYFFSVHERRGYHYVFFLDASGERRELREWVVVLSIALLSALIFMSYLILRKLLRPLKDLDAAVREVSAGKLDSNLAVTGKGELANLAKGFNQMLSSLRNTIEAKQQLVIDVSHELRSPLTRVKLALEMMPEHKAKNLASQDIVAMEDMIALILDQARYATGTVQLSLKKVDLCMLVIKVMEEFNSNRITFQNLNESIMLETDEKLLMIVLRNIIANALKYSQDSAGEVLLSLRHLEGRVEFCCQDYGVGIAGENLKKIFEPFYRIDPSRQRKTGGFGLGLAMVKRILDALGAEIVVSSQQGKGTCVRIKF